MPTAYAGLLAPGPWSADGRRPGRPPLASSAACHQEVPRRPAERSRHPDGHAGDGHLADGRGARPRPNRDGDEWPRDEHQEQQAPAGGEHQRRVEVRALAEREQVDQPVEEQAPEDGQQTREPSGCPCCGAGRSIATVRAV